MQVPHDAIDVFDPRLRQIIRPVEKGLKQTEFDSLFMLDTSKKPRPGQIVPCLMCKKPMIAPMYVGEAPDQICHECADTYRETAKLVCGRCGVVIGRVLPGPMECGYVVKKREVLHTDTCGTCSPGKLISVVREVVEWIKHHRPNKAIVTMHGVPTARAEDGSNA
jgi:hypothetical protein